MKHSKAKDCILNMAYYIIVKITKNIETHVNSKNKSRINLKIYTYIHSCIYMCICIYIYIYLD